MITGTMPDIEFIESHTACAPDGGPRAATFFVFRVGEHRVAVEVYDSCMMVRDGKQLSPGRVQTAAKEFLRHKIEQREPDTCPNHLVLDEPEIDSALSRLGEPRRF